jgi:acyl-CoA dehydrogenase
VQAAGLAAAVALWRHFEERTAMEFNPSPQVESLRERILAFMDEHVYPNEREAMEALDEEVAPGVPYPQILVEIRERAKSEGLWNLFLPDERHGPGLTNWEYGLLCEEMGRSPVVASMAFNCAAPDTGNMEILAEHGTPEHHDRWLAPLLDGQIRSCFSMTEPEVSGSDPTTLQTRAELEGDEWVINGHKWFTSGAVGADLAIAMVVTDPDAHPYARASMILVPTDNDGFNLIRPIPVMGHDRGPGHCEIRYEDCRVPESNLLGPRQAGFVIAQDRLGPGRIHHCMRAIGTAERAIEMMCRRASEREAFGGKLADKQFVQDFIAKSRMEVDQARLLTLYAAWQMDTEGKRAARQSISMIKVVAANVVMDVLDRAIQVHGSLGMTDDTPLAAMWRYSRMLRIADGPDEVHKMVIARRELGRWAKKDEEEAAPAAVAPERQPAAT